MPYRNDQIKTLSGVPTFYLVSVDLLWCPEKPCYSLDEQRLQWYKPCLDWALLNVIVILFYNLTKGTMWAGYWFSWGIHALSNMHICAEAAAFGLETRHLWQLATGLEFGHACIGKNNKWQPTVSHWWHHRHYQQYCTEIWSTSITIILQFWLQNLCFLNRAC